MIGLDRAARLVPVSTISIVCIISLLLWVYTITASFGACVRGTTEEHYKSMVAALDGTIALSLQISVSLVGLGAALLLGLKKGLQLSENLRLLLLLSIILFGQSALCAAWWRFGVAQAWLNECLNLVAEAALNSRFQAQAGFFLVGLLSLGVLVFMAYFQPRIEAAEEEDG